MLEMWKCKISAVQLSSMFRASIRGLLDRLGGGPLDKSLEKRVAVNIECIYLSLVTNACLDSLCNDSA